MNTKAVPVDERLRSAGLRVTRPRVAVLGVLDSSRDHPTVEAVVERVRATIGTVSVQAVYDVCEALRSVGLARRIELSGGPARYEARSGDNHHHLACRRCGVTVDIDCAAGRTPCLDPIDPHGFEIDEAEVVYWGECPDCLMNPSNSETEKP